MKKMFFPLALMAILVSCQPGSTANQGSSDSTSAEPVSDERSSSAPTAGMQAVKLFDGQTLNGWRGFKYQPTMAWEVENGTIHCDGHKKGAPAVDLITDSVYANFELSLQWKISPASNSGILFHVDENHDATYDSGPEYQIIDDKGWPGTLEPTQHTGCNYAMQVPDSLPVKPVGAWNASKILVNGPHVEYWLNGYKLLEYEVNSPEWKKQKATGKWKNTPGYGINESGHIALQYHGGDVWFRNINLKKL